MCTLSIKLGDISPAHSALLCYDCALTLPAEIERIWKRRVTGATLIYLFLRYATLFDCVLWCILESSRDNVFIIT